MKIGLIADIHLSPPGTPPAAYHNPYAMAEAAIYFQLALARCVEAAVDVIAVLGDLSHHGDAPSLLQGVRLAAATGLPVWVVPGNHDVDKDPAALAQAISRAGMPAVRLARPAGERGPGGVRIAGLPSLMTGAPEGAAHAVEAPDVAAWGDVPVLLLTHYPLLSLREEATTAGLKYAGDLDNRAAVAEAVLRRAAPTVIVHGHLHLRAAKMAETVLQLACGALIEPPFEFAILEIVASSGLAVSWDPAPVADAPRAHLPILPSFKRAWTFGAQGWAGAVPGATPASAIEGDTGLG
jgi:3',5'-cyclic AMP phosphodiesterase CpdA